eukprot:TRINITY_DN6695_c0_g1_i22.p1 TRINITY_DN6695_c0_g1~~TRINITY_DN6695_c0_g1_i22.p1  ORF type:complete len:181 (-),score=15.47 TRINITY_DN6695_c0_g1_i22:62-604(-)
MSCSCASVVQQQAFFPLLLLFFAFFSLSNARAVSLASASSLTAVTLSAPATSCSSLQTSASSTSLLNAAEAMDVQQKQELPPHRDPPLQNATCILIVAGLHVGDHSRLPCYKVGLLDGNTWLRPNDRRLLSHHCLFSEDSRCLSVSSERCSELLLVNDAITVRSIDSRKSRHSTRHGEKA